MMRESSEPIPTDLVIEILSRLPAKSIARCRCVSKLWDSMLLSPYFTELFLTKSSPRLLFAVKGFDDWCFFTSPQPQNLDEKPTSSLTADFQMKFSRPDHMGLDFRGHASGFIHFCRIVGYCNKVSVICNPSTGQYASLPPSPQGRARSSKSFLGFDPIDKQFKLLSINILAEERQVVSQILTLGTGNHSWRKIHCPLRHFPTHFGNEICINGVLYYSALSSGSIVIVCFNVRSEKFKFISTDDSTCNKNTKLINHKGSLGVITLEDDYGDGNHCFKLCMSVIKDSEKPEMEWSNFYFSWVDGFVDSGDFSIVGVTTVTSEIVLSMRYAYEPFYVVYINLERGTIQKVEIQGLHLGNHGRVEVFTDYVENLNFISMMKTTTSTSPPELKRNPVTTSKPPQRNGRRTTFESTNKFDSLRLLDHDECT